MSPYEREDFDAWLREHVLPALSPRQTRDALAKLGIEGWPTADDGAVRVGRSDGASTAERVDYTPPGDDPPPRCLPVFPGCAWCGSHSHRTRRCADRRRRARR